MFYSTPGSIYLEKYGMLVVLLDISTHIMSLLIFYVLKHLSIRLSPKYHILLHNIAEREY